MSVCILTGFAKKKKYVGTMYTCNGSDLPATQDFGTVQYQGPSETALIVPTTTVTYTIIGKTPCGNDIRRITTKTYSSRSGIGYKYDGGSYGYGVWDIQPGNGLIKTQWNIIAARLPQTLLGSAHQINVEYSCSVDGIPQYASNSAGNVYTIYCTNLGTLPCNDLASGCIQIIWVTSQITVYYLDVHEVWTYDLV